MGTRWIFIALVLVALGRVAWADESITDLTKACDNGKVDACLEAGTRFDEAKGVASDPAKALSFYLQACTLKVARGCLLAGDRLTRGAARDPVRARALLEKACDLKEPTACNNLGVDDESKGNHAAAAVHFEQGCKLDAATSCFNLGIYFQSEKVDLKQAAHYFERACNLGSADGCNELTTVLWNNNKLAAVDHARFVAAIKQSCALNNAEGCFNLGGVLHRGIVVTANIQEAVRAYLRSCALKQPLACDELGAIYEAGTQLPKDLTAATAHYDASCKLGGATGCERAKRLRGSDPVATPGAFKIDKGTLVLPSPIDFRASSRELTPESAAGLDHVVAYLNAKPEITLLRIEAHFELTTTSRPLDVVTKDRALVVARALVARGIDCNRLLAVGFGADKPITLNDTPENRALNRRIVVANAELKGKPIGGMPVAGGGSVADPVCKDSERRPPTQIKDSHDDDDDDDDDDDNGNNANDANDANDAKTPPQADTAPAQPERRLIPRGITEGMFEPGDATTLFGYVDTVEFEGEKGDYVSVYSETNSVVIEVNGDGLESLGKVEQARGNGGLATTIRRMRKAGTYRMQIQGNCDGGELTRGTCVPRRGRYVIAISDSPPNEGELRDRAVHTTRERRIRGYLTLSPLAVGVAASSRPAIAFNVSFALGYQITWRFGLDLVASGSIIGGAAFGEKQVDNAFSAFASVLVGPRFRKGTKRDGFIGVTPGLSYLTSLKGPVADDEIDASGVGLRFDWQWVRKAVIYGEAHLHGDLFMYIGFAAGL